MWNFIKELIPNSVFDFFENSFKVVLTFFIGIFTFLMKLIVNMNWVTFVSLIIFSVLSVAISVGMSYLFGKAKFKKQKEKELIDKYKNKEKIEIVKLQENFMLKLENLGFKYQDGFTFKEFMESISKNKNDLKNEAEDIVNKLYNLRYGYSLIKEEDIKNFKEISDKFLDNLKKSLVVTK